MEASVDPLFRGPDWKPITPKGGSFLHADFTVDLGRREHEVSVLFKPTQSTIVFTIVTDAAERARSGVLAQDYHVYHTRAGHFGHFSETEVVEAARVLASLLVKRA